MKNLYVVLLVLLAPLSPALAQSAEKPPSVYDTIWQNVTTWYDDSSNEVVQRVLFTGRFQHELLPGGRIDVMGEDRLDDRHNAVCVVRVRAGRFG